MNSKEDSEVAATRGRPTVEEKDVVETVTRERNRRDTMRRAGVDLPEYPLDGMEEE